MAREIKNNVKFEQNETKANEYPLTKDDLKDGHFYQHIGGHIVFVVLDEEKGKQIYSLNTGLGGFGHHFKTLIGGQIVITV